MTSPAPHRSPNRSRSQASRRPRTSVHSDCPPSEKSEVPGEPSPNLGKRSVSLTTLQPTIIQPRMAQLETLEAKMASIEVSLSNTPRRKKVNSSILNSSIRSIPKELVAKELENLRNALRDKENIIQSLRGQLTVPGLRLNSILNGNNNNNNGTNKELTEVEKKQAEDRLGRLKTDIENKRLAIKNLKMALERLDITDNIDVRIQQAELEYQLGREELNLLTLLEETRALQLCIEESNKSSTANNTIFSSIGDSDYVILRAVTVDFDEKNPKFGASQRDNMPGLWIDWALEETGLAKGDRLIEVNGKIVLTKTRDDLVRLLAAAPDPAQIVALKGSLENISSSMSTSRNVPDVAALCTELKTVKERAEEVQKVNDGLKSDNIRLTHRISYLEEQVSELLSRKSDAEGRIMSPTPVISKSNQNVTNINISSQNSPVSTSSSYSGEIQVFQKGPQVTALVTNISNLEKDKITIRSKSSLSNVSSTHLPPSSPQPDYQNHKHYRHKSQRHELKSPLIDNFDPNDKATYRKHHHHHREKDYNSETKSNSDYRASRKNIEQHRYSADYSKTNSEKDYRNTDVVDQSYKKATKIIQELTRTNKDPSLYEKHRQRCITASEKYNTDILKHYNARKSTSVLDFRSEVHIGPKYSDSRSVEELDAPEESPSKTISKLFKKMPSSRSVRSLDFDSDCNSTSTRNGCKSTDYNSEADNTRKQISQQNYYHQTSKSRPTPPKKPLRLSLHKTQSLQSVETSNNPVCSELPNGRIESRKRNYKGLTQTSSTEKNGDNMNPNDYKDQTVWTCYRASMNSGMEQGTWC